MHSKWVEYTKKEDFRAWAEALSVSPLTARIIKNRGVETLEEARTFLYGKFSDLADPSGMKDMDRAVALILQEKARGGFIVIASDYDDDGIFAGKILLDGLTEIGLPAKILTPHRSAEGYGLNRRIIDEAIALHATLILTCDNGIAARDEIQYAKDRGLTVIVTDHHEPQYESLPADAVVDPKQKDCPYAFKELCGAGVALRLVEALYRAAGVPREKAEDLLEYAAVATVADVVPLLSENRIIVKEGLQRLNRTEKPAFQALLDMCDLTRGEVSAYSLGFVIGPSFNAVSRLLGRTDEAHALLAAKTYEEALPLARRLRELNESRKAMTEEAEKAAEAVVSENRPEGPVWLIRVDAADSIIGIVAGKIKEKYYHPVFVITGMEGAASGNPEAGLSEDGILKTESSESASVPMLKGSGRSIPGYHMQQALVSCGDLLTKFGGHAMAAGLTFPAENLAELTRRLNEACGLTEKDLTPVETFEARVKISYVTEALVSELSLLEPFGTGNTQPMFALPEAEVRSIKVLGKNRNVTKLVLSDGEGTAEAVLFGADAANEFQEFIRTEFGENALNEALSGFGNRIRLSFLFHAKINEFMGHRTVQFTIDDYCRIPHKML